MVSENKALDLRRESSFRGPDLKLFVKDVRDRGRKRAITVKSWSTICDVKNVLQQILHVPPSAQHVYYGPLLTSGGELPNHRTLHDAGIYKSGETLLLEIRGRNNSDDYESLSASSTVSAMASLRQRASRDICVSSSLWDLTPRRLRQLVQQARRGFDMGLKPELVLDGSGGSYFLKDARKVKVAVFKPADEEPYAENNPRGYIRQVGGGNASGGDLVLREGVKPGELCLREVAAYLLDHGGFAGVPMTTLAEARHPAFHVNGSMLNVSQGGASIGSHSFRPGGTSAVSSSPSNATESAKKVGSLQEFIRAECSMDDMGHSRIAAEEIHKIAILDIRLMNADRNAANLLCRRRPHDGSIQLVPIDHGFCLRSVCDTSWFDWCWLDWPQLKEPLSQKSKDYIAKLDIDADARMLKEQLNIGDEALDYFRASSKILQEGVKIGLTLYDIAIMCCRNDNMGDVPSNLEILTSMASELATSALENGRWHHAAASRALVDQLSPLPSTSEKILKSSSPSSSNGVVSPNTARIIKSASSANLSSLRHALEEAAAASSSQSSSSLENRCDVGNGHPKGTDGGNSSVGNGNIDVVPCMNPSETSSDSGDGYYREQHECEEWAAAVVADVSLDRSIAMLRGEDGVAPVDGHPRRRFLDDDSASSVLSSSPKGFWHISPAAAGAGRSSDDFSDDDTLCWSPASPRDTFDVQRCGGSSSRLVSFAIQPPPVEDQGRRTSMTGVLSASPPRQLSSSPICTFAESVAGGLSFLKPPVPQGSISNMERETSGGSGAGAEYPSSSSSNHPGLLAGFLIPPAKTGLPRSKSYSAFSQRRSSSVVSTSSSGDRSRAMGLAMAAAKDPATAIEGWRDYFSKFVDLVIEREILLAARRRRHSHEEGG